MNRIILFIQKEVVCCIASLCALIALCFNPPATIFQFAEYIDVRILGLLFALMTTVAGLRNLGIFDSIARRVSHVLPSSATAVFVLWLLCFVFSVFITNDVALLTFVPLAAAVLSLLGATRWLLYTVVLQTVAANLGSLLTPMGNPQNLFLYSFYNIPVDSFFTITVPLFAVSFVLLVLLTIPVFIAERKTGKNFPEKSKKNPVQFVQQKQKIPHSSILTILYVVLSILAVLSVFRLIPWQVATVCAILIIGTVDHHTAHSVDWFLLITFGMFFIFSGTVSTIEPVRKWLATAVCGREKFAAICVSQIISNVPAALLLSAFTTDGAALVTGTNIGGLGSLIASLASLISYKLYCTFPDAHRGRYIVVFTGVNIVLLATLLVFDQIYPHI